MRNDANIQKVGDANDTKVRNSSHIVLIQGIKEDNEVTDFLLEKILRD